MKVKRNETGLEDGAGGVLESYEQDGVGNEQWRWSSWVVLFLVAFDEL